MPKDTIRFCTLESGSAGNSIYCETADGAVIIDAGISCRKVLNHFKKLNVSHERIDGIILTHHHSDHIKCVGALSRGLQKPQTVPVFMTSGTAKSLPKTVGALPARSFNAGERLCMGGFHIETIATPHDAEGSVALVLQRGNTRLGVFTDLGHCFEEMKACLPSLDAILIESNYDPNMLRESRKYPEHVKARIRGPKGHLSNQEAAQLIRDYASDRLKAIVLGHLSENNNMPELALDSHRRIAAEFISEKKPLLSVAPRYIPSKIFVVKNNNNLVLNKEGASL